MNEVRASKLNRDQKLRLFGHIKEHKPEAVDLLQGDIAQQLQKEMGATWLIPKTLLRDADVNIQGVSLNDLDLEPAPSKPKNPQHNYVAKSPW